MDLRSTVLATAPGLLRLASKRNIGLGRQPVEPWRWKPLEQRLDMGSKVHERLLEPTVEQSLPFGGQLLCHLEVVLAGGLYPGDLGLGSVEREQGGQRLVQLLDLGRGPVHGGSCAWRASRACLTSEYILVSRPGGTVIPAASIFLTTLAHGYVSKRATPAELPYLDIVDAQLEEHTDLAVALEQYPSADALDKLVL
ncbi:hypothetical protein Micbo1qcDRAFT_173466 [Microdochium bolleyi]|uniref:Uncharacterized protein n=1 Tax=Microdochium bolleyi TaxID=196109 RepID=A0A136JBX8_9PEZI|nr:hypothetical protein Micbo1qcDRAFT_173466 [Microdochium bolleyi]